jgi:nitrite reductase (NADH) large subunit
MRETLVIIGNGMVGHKLIELLCQRDAAERYHIVTFCEEPRTAYDRIHLTDFFSGKSADELMLATPDTYRQNSVQVFVGDRVASIDRSERKIVSSKGVVIRYDRLVLATGSYPFVPPIKGNETRGTFVYRTLEDLEKIKAYAPTAKVGAVLGGGLLGLECANALRMLGLEAHVIEFSSRLMNVQIDDAGGALLRKKVEALGVRVHTGKSTAELLAGENGRLARILFADGSELPTDMLVFSTGIRPRDELARQAGLAVGERGGIVIDERCCTSDERIFAIGECALYKNRIYGLAAPGYRMAEVLVENLLDPAGGTARFTGADLSTKLKLLGVDVASFGDGFATLDGAREISYGDALGGTYKKIVVDAAGKRLMGGMLVGDAASYGMLTQIMQNGLPLPAHPEDLILPSRDAQPAGMGVDMIPASAKICSCENVSKGAICDAICRNGLTSVAEIKKCTGAGTGCGGCVPLVTDILKAEMKRSGVKVSNSICEHFAYSRQELYHLIRVHNIHTFDELLDQHGKGLGCEVCKPAVASILASTWNEYVLTDAHFPLQDTNDHFLANIQRDGSYSVVPRIPGGEITPDKLIVLGRIAKEFDLYVKITGAQRVDMFGARVDQLPLIWKQLVEAGFESGHAYGKALRTVKSCVGSTWCRYGQQDSVSLAIALEERYKGLRAPHKIKSAVSGCTRECAEAQGKDFGLIATEKGYNLYVCGNGGMKPQHAQLLAEDLDEAMVVKYVDRFLMFYIRTADRLQRTATWLNNLDGGLDYLKQVIIEDKLGICAELERDMQAIVGSFQCEWRTTLQDEEKLKRFRHFVNSDQPDPNIVRVLQRGQRRPAAVPYEREPLVPVDLVPLTTDEHG